MSPASQEVHPFPMLLVVAMVKMVMMVIVMVMVMVALVLTAQLLPVLGAAVASWHKGLPSLPQLICTCGKTASTTASQAAPEATSRHRHLRSMNLNMSRGMVSVSKSIRLSRSITHTTAVCCGCS